MNKRIAIMVVALLMLGATRIALGQGSDVTGEEYRGNVPLVNCTVTIGDKFGFTDVNGRFRIHNVAAGKYALVVSQNGHTLREQQVEIGNGETRIPRITL